jgi:hypothetical protein
MDFVFMCGFGLISGVAKTIYYFLANNNLQKINFDQLVDNKSTKMKEKVRKKLFCAHRVTPKPPESTRSARQKQTHAKLVKSARNPQEIRGPPEIFFAR